MRLERHHDVAVLRLEAGKANAITPEFLSGLSDLLDAVDASDARAIVLTGYDRFFCAGLALPALIDLPRPALRSFMDTFSAVMLRLFAHPLPVVAAINGHAVAGGCVLALQADERVMVESGAKIGLNEIALGVGLPAVVIETLRAQVPAWSLVPIVQHGRLVEPAEAHALGLVHELTDDVLARAIERASTLGAHPRAAHAFVKASLRRPALQAIRATHDTDAEAWLDTWYSADAQAILRAAVARMNR